MAALFLCPFLSPHSFSLFSKFPLDFLFADFHFTEKDAILNSYTKGGANLESYLAHIRPARNGAKEARQTVSIHSRHVAEYAAQALAPCALPAAGYLAGLVHDMGKYTDLYQNYLQRGEGKRGSINHTFAGVRLLLERYFHEQAADFSGVTTELLALASGGHHGLFDCLDSQEQSGFHRRLTKEGIRYQEAMENFFRFCTDEQELDRCFQDALAELTPVLEKILSMTDKSSPFFNCETAFYSGLLSRLLLSGVIEGDRRDTAEFMNGAQFSPERSAEDLEQLWSACLSRVEEQLDKLPQSSEIDRARRAISNQCRKGAAQPGGVFRLNVPTGGGKTLSSLRFALAHAKIHRKQRIIYASPLLSILEQNADEIRKYLQDDSLILEHHSNVVLPKESPEHLDQKELLMETWDAPVILTTLVQLLNTLFSGKTSSIRRFHALCGSVIVIDEVQTVPAKMLSLFSLAVNFISEICGASVVLCSATQPCIEQIEHPLHTPILDLVPYSKRIWDVFQRTRLHYMGELSLEDIARFALARPEKNLLIVCNKKTQAEALFRLLEGAGAFALFQLSASMCVQHRRDVLKQVRASLESRQKTICVSTQVIEAGINISFDCVIRLTAGMDSVIQSAGRCNRNGGAGPGVLAPVYLISLRNEQLGRLPDIQRGKAAALDLLNHFHNHPEQYGGCLDSEQAVRYYCQALYSRMRKHSQDYIWQERQPSLLSLLSMNEWNAAKPPYYFRQAFRLAGSLFQVFEEDTTDVIVPYKEGAALITELCGAQAKQDPGYLRSCLKKSRPYTVSLYQYQIDRLAEKHSLILLHGGAIGLRGHYSEKTGFSADNPNPDF